MADMKTTIIESMYKGDETLKRIILLRAKGKDYTGFPEETNETISKFHRNLKLKVEDSYMNTERSKTIKLVSVNGEKLPNFESGQYINVFVNIDGVRTSRPYSISSPGCNGDYYEITVGRIPENGFVSDYLIDNLQKGDQIEANGPAGTFHFHPVFHKKDSVFIAGGSGITPFMSMLREIMEKEQDRKVHLIYGVANTDNIIFREELEDMAKKHDNFKYDLVYSEPEEDWHGLKGFVTEELLSQIVDNPGEKTFYLCGPDVMTQSVENSLKNLGIKKSMIRREMFSQNQNIHKQPGWPEGLDPETQFNITVNEGEKKKNIIGKAGESILTALERNGIRMNVCCRSGECSLCRIKLIGGDVYLASGILKRRADEKFGYIHSCKAFPISDIEILI